MYSGLKKESRFNTYTEELRIRGIFFNTILSLPSFKSSFLGILKSKTGNFSLTTNRDTIISSNRGFLSSSQQALILDPKYRHGYPGAL